MDFRYIKEGIRNPSKAIKYLHNRYFDNIIINKGGIKSPTYRHPIPFYRTHLASDLIRTLPDGHLRWQIIRYFAYRYHHIRPRAFGRKGASVLLIGCCWIETILEWRTAVGPKGEIYVIEADPNICELLKKNVARRNIDNVTIINRAVWNENDEITHLIHEDNRYSYVKNMSADDDSGNPPIESYSGEIQVQASPLKNILDEYQVTNLNHIEIAVSGSEYEIIEGAINHLNSIQSKGDTLRTLSTFTLGDSNKPVSEEVSSLLQQIGYKTVSPKCLKVIGLNPGN